MKRIFVLLTLCLSIAFPSVAQMKIDTLYYDKDWKGVESKAFATYYRIIATSGDSNFGKKFRDYYITGELQAEGSYVTIDRYDDSKSVFDGECVNYSKDGKITEKRTLVDGMLSGEYTKYSDEGLLLVHSFYKEGKLDGICTEFSENGVECVQIEYKDGEVVNDCCVISNSEGWCSKITLSTRTPIFESPALSEKEVEYVKGEAWPYYNKNGVVISITNQSVKDYGKYYKVPIIIANNSMFPFDFDPNKTEASLTDKKGKTQALKVYSSEEYLKKVRRWQNALMVFNALGESAAASKAGYSSSTTTTTYSGGSSTYGTASAVGSGGYAFGSYSGSTSYGGTSRSTTVSYDGAAAYQAQLIASNRIAEYDNALLSEREAKEEGYLKKTTVYPGETISGYVHVQRKKGETMNINVDINGAIYTFNWNIGK